MKSSAFISTLSLCTVMLMVSCGCDKTKTPDVSQDPSGQTSEDPSGAVSEDPAAQSPARYVKNLSMSSKVLGSTVLYSILLPEGYEENTSKRYPVVYMLHGLGDDNNSWNGEKLLKEERVEDRINRLERKGLEDMIYVFPMGYQCYYCNKYDGSFNYMDMFIQELVPYIDDTYRTIPDKRHRSVTGYSMGGFGAWVLAGKHPETFIASAPLSMSFRTDEQYMNEEAAGWNTQWGGIFGGRGETGAARLTDYYKEHCPYYAFNEENRAGLESVKWFFTCGDDEERLLIANDSLHVLLRDRGFDHEFRVNNGAHTSMYWIQSLDEVLPMFAYYMNGGEKWPGIDMEVPSVPSVQLDGNGAYKTDRYKADGTGTVLYVFHDGYPGIQDVVALLSGPAQYKTCAIVPWDVSVNDAADFGKAGYTGAHLQALAIGTAGGALMGLRPSFEKTYYVDASTGEDPVTAKGEKYVILNTDNGIYYHDSGALYTSCKRSGATFQYRVTKGTSDRAADILRCLENNKSLFTL